MRYEELGVDWSKRLLLFVAAKIVFAVMSWRLKKTVYDNKVSKIEKNREKVVNGMAFGHFMTCEICISCPNSI